MATDTPAAPIAATTAPAAPTTPLTSIESSLAVAIARVEALVTDTAEEEIAKAKALVGLLEAKAKVEADKLAASVSSRVKAVETDAGNAYTRAVTDAEGLLPSAVAVAEEKPFVAILFAAIGVILGVVLAHLL